MIHIEKRIEGFIFLLLFFIFTICYLVFFPGVFSYDSYFTYSQSLDLLPYMAGTVPIYTILWKIFNNNNFGPFVANYLLILLSFAILYFKTKRFIIQNFFLIFLLLPASMLTFVWVWKDNALITLLFLCISLIIPSKEDVSKLSFIINMVLIFGVLFLAYAVRINAVFAIIPLLGYIISTITKNKFKIISYTILCLGLFVLINNFINTNIYRAQKINFTQTLLYTDILKMNYYHNDDIQLPLEFKTKYYNESNINMIMGKYTKFSCNDIIFMPYKIYNNEEPVVHGSNNPAELKALEKVWFNAVTHHPIGYLSVRISQLYNALSDNNISLFEFFDYTRLWSHPSYNSKFNSSINANIISHLRSHIVKVTYLVKDSSTFIWFISLNIVWFILNAILCVISYLFRHRLRNNSFIPFIVSLSGILYVVGYLPILPCTDYRYFIWNIASFWLSLGVFITLYVTDSKKVLRNG